MPYRLGYGIDAFYGRTLLFSASPISPRDHQIAAPSTTFTATTPAHSELVFQSVLGSAQAIADKRTSPSGLTFAPRKTRFCPDLCSHSSHVYHRLPSQETVVPHLLYNLYATFCSFHNILQRQSRIIKRKSPSRRAIQ